MSDWADELLKKYGAIPRTMNAPAMPRASQGGGWNQLYRDVASGIKMVKGALVGNPEDVADSSKPWWGSATIRDPFTGEQSITIPVPGERTMGAVDAALAAFPFIGGIEKQGERFFSQLKRSLELKMPGRTTAEQALAIARKGAKAEELRWSGLEDLLSGDPKRIVTRDEVLRHVEANAPELREKMIGDKPWSTKFPRGVEMRRATAEDVTAFNEIYDGNDVPARENDWMLFHQNGEPVAMAQGALNEDTAQTRLGEIFNDMAGAGGRAKPGPRFTQYTVPGGENHRELVVTMPQKVPTEMKPPSYEDWLQTVFGQRTLPADQNENFIRNQYHDFLAGETTEQIFMAHPEGTYATPAGHAYGDPELDVNRLLHLRMNDRDAGKTLFMEELQSDWHQAGRKEGYTGVVPKLPDGYSMNRATEDGVDEFGSEYKKGDWILGSHGNAELSAPGHLNEVDATRRIAADEPENGDGLLFGERAGGTPTTGVPDAPFKTTWHELGMKRMLQEAADVGYERLAWTTGAQQADRYKLSKHVDRLTYDPVTNSLTGYKDGNKIFGETRMPNELPELIGDEPAKKLLENIAPSRKVSDPVIYELSGMDLDVGGEGMRGFYDKMLPDYANKLGKKYGIKVERRKVISGWKYKKTGNKIDMEHADPSTIEFDKKMGLVVPIEDEVWSLPITDEMRADLRDKGQALHAIPPVSLPKQHQSTDAEKNETHVGIGNFMRNGRLR